MRREALRQSLEHLTHWQEHCIRKRLVDRDQTCQVDQIELKVELLGRFLRDDRVQGDFRLTLRVTQYRCWILCQTGNLIGGGRRKKRIVLRQGRKGREVMGGKDTWC